MFAQCSAVPCRVMLAFCVSSMFLSHPGYINTMDFIKKALSIVQPTQKPSVSTNAHVGMVRISQERLTVFYFPVDQAYFLPLLIILSTNIIFVVYTLYIIYTVFYYAKCVML